MTHVQMARLSTRSFFDASDRNIDRVDELRRRAVIELDDGEAAVDVGIDAKNFHGVPLRSSSDAFTPLNSST